MPALSATSTAVFNSVGISASAIYSVFTGLIGTAVDFSLWLVQVSWPFLLVIGFILLLWGMANKYHFFGSRGR